MNLTTLMRIGDNITEGSSLGERAVVGLQVVAIGMGVVFGVLVLLIAILQLFKLFAKKNTKPDIVTNAPVATATPAPTSAPVSVSAVPASEEEALVAIATAAIAAARGESECAFNVISIKKIVK